MVVQKTLEYFLTTHLIIWGKFRVLPCECCVYQAGLLLQELNLIAVQICAAVLLHSHAVDLFCYLFVSLP